MSTENVYAIVYDSLNKTSPQLAAQWIQRYPPAAANNADINAQLSNVNAFWRIKLGSLNIDTLEARSCLVDSLTLVTWRKDFIRYVIPIIINNFSSI